MTRHHNEDKRHHRASSPENTKISLVLLFGLGNEILRESGLVVLEELEGGGFDEFACGWLEFLTGSSDGTGPKGADRHVIHTVAHSLVERLHHVSGSVVSAQLVSEALDKFLEPVVVEGVGPVLPEKFGPVGDVPLVIGCVARIEEALLQADYAS
eukprot:CAMPEP_0118990220 /NCGR_PEP_ID=MMETSP1173-20130426/49515_1 /TAXON_ID=1034831 /ORGANISM="Rhizochromulina marina cf, Strain CCMP1243" /LENGTH=154 /DNA_ID=CAMNT_0006941263 /DNA_START=221 /DNA_END=685 /DNA_ORIENTATION=+